MGQASALLSCFSPAPRTISANPSLLVIAGWGHHEMTSAGWAWGGLQKTPEHGGLGHPSGEQLCGKQNTSRPSGLGLALRPWTHDADFFGYL